MTFHGPSITLIIFCSRVAPSYLIYTKFDACIVSHTLIIGPLPAVLCRSIMRNWSHFNVILQFNARVLENESMNISNSKRLIVLEMLKAI